MVSPNPVDGCLGCRGHHRHRHPVPEFNDAALTCKCGATDWYLLSGGPLPTLLSCAVCSGTLNIQHYLASGGGFSIDRITGQ